MEFLVEPFDPRLHSAEAPSALAASLLELRNVLSHERDCDYVPVSQATYLDSLKGTETVEQRTVMARVGTKAIGQAIVSMHHMETNADKAELELEVHREYRRQGVGSALLASVVAIAKARGRKSIGAYNVKSDVASGFWTGLGAGLKTVERESRMWLGDTDESMMAEWIEARNVRASDYRL